MYGFLFTPPSLPMKIKNTFASVVTLLVASSALPTQIERRGEGCPAYTSITLPGIANQVNPQASQLSKSPTRFGWLSRLGQGLGIGRNRQKISKTGDQGTSFTVWALPLVRFMLSRVNL